MVQAPAYLWVLTLTGTIATVGMTSFVVYRGAQLARLGHRRPLGLGLASVVLLGGWAAISGVIAARGGYQSADGGRLPGLPIAFAVAPIVMVAATRIPVVARALAAPGMRSRLKLPHVFRVVGAAFLIMTALGRLPALFAVPAGVGDIAIGIAAPFVAHSSAMGTGNRLAMWFDALGMLDLVTALTLAILTGFVLDVIPSTHAITELPLALIPSAVVPLLLTLHITSLRRPARRHHIANASSPESVVTTSIERADHV